MAPWNTGSAGDGLLRIYNCSNITIRNMLIHDAPNDCDVVKIGGAGATTTNILVENCVIYNPAHRTDGSSYQECVDMYPADRVTLRHCWLYHTPTIAGDVLTFCKGGLHQYHLGEQRVRPGLQQFQRQCVLHGGRPKSGCPSGLLQSYRQKQSVPGVQRRRGVRALWCLRLPVLQQRDLGVQGRQGRHPVLYRQPSAPGPIRTRTSTSTTISCGRPTARPSLPIEGVWTVDGTYIPTNFVHDYNLYYQASGGDVNINAEAHSLRGLNPGLTSPSSPVLGTDSWATIVARFKPLQTSPVINAGLSLGTLGTCRHLQHCPSNADCL